ncbi:MAG: endonuclease/exonuclease/phosphatase family protein [Chloroflexota bacterium]|nr:endonuclease/exonuclease/phosphatase family protein [Chloroflexota bacterium]
MTANHRGKQPVRRACIIITVCLVYLLSCSSSQNYTEPGGPFFEGNYAAAPQEHDGSLKVITWNLNFAEKIETAIITLGQVEELKDADVLLLQEMDEDSVEIIAQRLFYNYVYYPASIHPRKGNNFGNAILTRWPITDHSKIILPNSPSRINQSRNAIRAVIVFEGVVVVVYNTHLEMSWMLPSSGDTQVDDLVDQIDQDAGRIVLGGDFNSWNPGCIKYLDKLTGQIGLDRVTEGIGYTFEFGELRLELDHIFYNDVAMYEAGVWRGTNASDHFPVWVMLKIHTGDRDM